MATPKRLASGQITSTSLTTAYVSPTGFNARISKISFTNVGNTESVIDIYYNDSVDRLVRRITLPGKIGAERPYYDAQRVVLNAGEIIKFQSSVAVTFNYFIYGVEISTS